MKLQNLMSVFRRLGFSKHTHAVYQSIAADGPILASHVISKVKAYRPAVYKSLYELENARLIVRQKQGGRYYWCSTHPDRITSLFNNAVEDVQSLVPKTKEKVEESVTSSMNIFHGPKGIRAVFDDVITHTKTRDTFYRYTSEKDLDVVNSYLSKDYRKRRDAKHLERLVISNPVSGTQKKSRLERFIKFIPKEASTFTQNIIQLVYGDRVAFIDLNKEEAIVIENAALADFQKVIFKQLYKKL